MKTEILSVDPRHVPLDLHHAAEVLLRGGLVAFPTETVYGLGANALDGLAVGKIFAAKGRPAHNPLIVHVAHPQNAHQLANNWPDSAQRLVEAFWPGSLTIVAQKATVVPDIVTAGGATIGLRMPDNPIALALIETAGVPVAAPSANRSNRLSPTAAQHVIKDLDGKIDMIIDGGPAGGGLESTVLDVSVSPPRLLRPGLIGHAEIEKIIGPIERREASISGEGKSVLRSPGMMPRHYAPRAPLQTITVDEIDLIHAALGRKERIGWLAFATAAEFDHPALVRIAMPLDVKEYSATLYSALHRLDAKEVQHIYVSLPPDTEEWLAVHDRLRRASAQ